MLPWQPNKIVTGHKTRKLGRQSSTGWSIVAKESCILRHRGVQLKLAYTWAWPVILVAGKGRGGMFSFLQFLYFHSCSSFFPCPSLSLGDDTKWPTSVDVLLNPNILKKTIIQWSLLPNMVHITSVVMEKMQFNHFLISVWEFSVAMTTKPRDRLADLAIFNCTYPFNICTQISCRPWWLSWMRRPTGDKVTGSTPAEVSNILLWRLIMKYFLRSFSSFRWFKKDTSVSGERMCTILVNHLEN